MTLDRPTPCLMCGTELRRVHPPHNDEPEDQPPLPYGGTVFQATGHYGSIYDPAPALGPSREWLLINLCDGCLTTAADAGRVVQVEIIEYRGDRLASKPWNARDEMRVSEELSEQDRTQRECES